MIDLDKHYKPSNLRDVNHSFENVIDERKKKETINTKENLGGSN